jgi:hypothetical protein
LTGRISTSRTGMPRRASCQAASLPASPAPTTVTLLSLMAYRWRKLIVAFFNDSVNQSRVSISRVPFD